MLADVCSGGKRDTLEDAAERVEGGRGDQLSQVEGSHEISM